MHVQLGSSPRYTPGGFCADTGTARTCKHQVLHKINAQAGAEDWWTSAGGGPAVTVSAVTVVSRKEEASFWVVWICLNSLLWMALGGIITLTVQSVSNSSVCLYSFPSYSLPPGTTGSLSGKLTQHVFKAVALIIWHLLDTCHFHIWAQSPAYCCFPPALPNTLWLWEGGHLAAPLLLLSSSTFSSFRDCNAESV